MPYEYDNNKMQNIFLHRYDNKGIPHVLMTKSSKTDKNECWTY